MKQNLQPPVSSLRPALTLIEVTTAMLLLGTLLVALLLGYSRHAVRIENASQRLKVMQAAERQLADWHLQFGFAPVNDEGELTVDGKIYNWETRPIEQQIDRKFMLGKISYRIFDTDTKLPILSLELIVPSWDETGGGRL
jgi:type II secretory pathway pseudopilin PulG